MFICKRCVTQFKTEMDLGWYSLSFGPCEFCNKVSECLDVTHGQYQRISKRRKKKE